MARADRHLSLFTICETSAHHGITVVAAAGNSFPDNKPKPVHCPAAVEDVIAVGGLEVECTASIDSELESKSSETERSGPYWAKKEINKEYPKMTPNGVFCGQRKCYEDRDCIPNQHSLPWKGNPLPTDGKPDVLAPVHYPDVLSDGSPYLCVGSSYAAPIATGTLGLIFSEISAALSDYPSPYDTRQAIVSGATRIDEGHLKKLNVTRTLNRLLSEKDN